MGPSSNNGLPNESRLQNSSNKMLVEGGMGGVWEVREGWEGWEGCERGGSEEERMDEILLVIGKKRGRESEREGEKVGKEVGSGERREKL